MKYFAFQWHITDECDQRCKHCYIFSEAENKPIDSMSFDQMRLVLSKCEAFCALFGRVPYFYVTGGDPVLHKDFWRLAELLKSKSIAFTLMGNPFHLNDSVCARLRALGCEKYQMSLDGTRLTHDKIRKPGSFDAVLEKIPVVNRSGIRSVIMTTVSSMNIEEIPQIIDIAAQAGVKVFAFARYCPVSREKSTGISPEEYRNLLAVCDKKFKEYERSDCETYFNRKDHLWTLYEYERGDFKIPPDAQKGMIYSGCNCGNSHLTILPTGEIYACRRVQNSLVGNIFADDLAEIWLTKMEKYRDYTRFKKCSSCELLAFCRGCPAVAAGTHGDFYDPDPQCWKKTD